MPEILTLSASDAIAHHQPERGCTHEFLKNGAPDSKLVGNFQRARRIREESSGGRPEAGRQHWMVKTYCGSNLQPVDWLFAYGQRGGLTGLGVLWAMDINNQFDKEMLSAYLDDALTATELGQVERWLAEDPHAADYLERLRSNRNTLKALASLPTVGLRPTFAERVVAQAVTAKAASLQELAAEAETQLPQAGRVHLPASQPTTKSRPWWAWATIATTAAAISWFAFAPKWETAKPLTLIPSAGADANGGPSAGDVASNSPGVPTGQDPAIGNQLPVVRPDEMTTPAARALTTPAARPISAMNAKTWLRSS